MIKLDKILTEQAINDFRNYNKEKEIRQAIEAIREYIKILVILEEQQTDIADKLPFERLNIKLSMAIKDLEYQLEKEKEESVRLSTTVRQSCEIESLGTNYLAGSTCFVFQDASFYILDTNHKWVKV